jgi:transcriptional regulator with XRE-family HTH domain
VRQPLKTVLDDLGRRLAELRDARGWTQSKAAERAGMAEKDYQSIENGRRAITMRTLVCLADTFEVSVRELLDPPKARAPRKPGRPRRQTTTPEFIAAAESPSKSVYGARKRKRRAKR